MKNNTGKKSLDFIEADPRIKSAWTEEDNTSGKWMLEIWADLSPGFNLDGTSVIHAYSVRDFREQLRNVEAGNPY